MTKLEEIARIVDPLPWNDAYWKNPDLGYTPAMAAAVQKQGQMEGLNVARAVIECLMEPDEPMISAAVSTRPARHEIWQAMLKAVLDEQA